MCMLESFICEIVKIVLMLCATCALSVYSVFISNELSFISDCAALPMRNNMYVLSVVWGLIDVV